ncbi:hypothetical protein ACLQ28_31465 [Micromonospora sp. DT201]|uniref:hypothetical protein n=1 Tax=Micromonospora sp. DT201 TaxID=3393442 RepID=UPI003CF9E2E5
MNVPRAGPDYIRQQGNQPGSCIVLSGDIQKKCRSRDCASPPIHVSRCGLIRIWRIHYDALINSFGAHTVETVAYPDIREDLSLFAQQGRLGRILLTKPIRCAYEEAQASGLDEFRLQIDAV